MYNDDSRELREYFKLCSYRDGEYILLEEYEELEDIIRRNRKAQYLESVRYKYLTGNITEEEYNRILDEYYDEFVLHLVKRIK